MKRNVGVDIPEAVLGQQLLGVQAGEYFYYNRGHNREVIFRDRRDDSFFIRKLRESVCKVSPVVA